jgi:hypothetical protein
MRSPVAHRFYDGIKISTVTVPSNTFGGPEVETVRETIRGLIIVPASQEALTGGTESSTGASRGGRNKVTVNPVLYFDGRVVINESDRVTDRDGKQYTVIGVGNSIFGSHGVAFLEKVS